MPLRSLSTVRGDLKALLVEDLPAALTALRELLPETSDKQGLVLALQAALKQLNKDRIRGVIDTGEYARRLARISADAIDLISALEEADFEPPAKTPKKNAEGIKQGSVLYRVPRRMPLRKPSICAIRVAIDEDAILEDLVLDEHVRLRERVGVSDVMSAELIDSEGNVFEIVAFNAYKQTVRDTGYTQWLFRVTPKIEGEHQLLVNVSLLEFDRNTGEYVPRDISILETVTIVTEAPAPMDEEPPFQSAGQPLTLGFAEAPVEKVYDFETGYNKPGSPFPGFPTAPVVQPSVEIPTAPPKLNQPGESKQSNKSLRALALFLAFLMLGTGTVWAVPEPVRDWWVVSLRDNAEAYAEYIDEYKDKTPDNPRLEKAYFRKAAKTDSLGDLRAYQRVYLSGQYRREVLERIAQKELQSVENLEKQPDGTNIRRYLADYPDARRLSRVKKAVERLPQEEQTQLLPLLEDAYVRSMQEDPSAEKLRQYRRDFREVRRLDAMAEAAAARPETLHTAQPLIDSILEEKAQEAVTPADAQTVLKILKKSGSAQAAGRVEKIIEKKPALLRKAVLKDFQETKNLLQTRERSGARTPEPPKPADNAEEHDWQAACAADNLEAYTRFRNKYPKSAHLEDLRARVRALKPGVIPETASGRDADADGVPDRDDACPNEKGDAEYKGCPPPRQEAPGNRKSGLMMVRVPGGKFTMGDDKDRDDNNCEHPVSVKTFSIGKYEVTQADWRRVMGENPPELQFKGCDDCPVESVSWDDVQDFLKKLNAQSGQTYRLPTESEWEYAARGGRAASQTSYAYAGSNDANAVAWYSGNSGRKTHPVGTKKANVLGIHDMSGNVLEWCQDTYGPYPCDKKTEKRSSRVMRGGSWGDSDYFGFVQYRFNNFPGLRLNYNGFRLAQDK